MRRRRALGRIWWRAVSAVAAAGLAGCGPQSMLDAKGPIASQIAGLWWIMFAATSIAAAGTIAGLLYAVRRARRAAGPETATPVPARERTVILLLGAAVPAVALVGFTVLAVRTGVAVSGPPGEPDLVVEVIGHQFWWEVRYPTHEVVTANEIRIPARRTVEFRVSSADVIHSFWVPKLAGKIDMNPQRVNVVRLEASEPGTYRGQCTEFCGVQHALMAFEVRALPPTDFRRWLERRRAPPAAPQDPAAVRGQEVFFEAECAACHAIRGVHEPAFTGRAGPDLTDLADRRTLGALTLRNTRGNLAGWILDPHQFKPGNRMPPTTLDSNDLRALLSYLETLH